MARKASPQTRAEAVRLRMKGVPVTAIASKLGVSHGAVVNWSRSALQAEARRMRLLGVPVPTIAQRLSTHEETAEKWCQGLVPGCVPDSEPDHDPEPGQVFEPPPRPTPPLDPNWTEWEQPKVAEVEIEWDDEKRLRGTLAEHIRAAAQAKSEGNHAAALKYDKLAFDYSEQLRKLTKSREANDDMWTAPKEEVERQRKAIHEVIAREVADINRVGMVCQECGRRLRAQLAAGDQKE